MWVTRPTEAPPRVPRPRSSVMVIAHRGASAYAPEHTTAAYDLALRLGADYIEPDVHMTSDGVLVAIHDPTIDRTATRDGGAARGLVSSLTMDELRSCEFGSWFNRSFPSFARPEYSGLRIQSLEDIFARYGDRASYYIETKSPDSPGMEEELVKLIKRYGLMEPSANRWRVVIQSFSASSLEQTHALAPSLPLIQLFHVQSSKCIQMALEEVRTYAAGIGPWKNAIDRQLVEACHERGLQIHAYTVGDTFEEVSTLVSFGVDGMFTDYPDRLDDILNRG